MNTPDKSLARKKSPLKSPASNEAQPDLLPMYVMRSIVSLQTVLQTYLNLVQQLQNCLESFVSNFTRLGSMKKFQHSLTQSHYIRLSMALATEIHVAQRISSKILNELSHQRNVIVNFQTTSITQLGQLITATPRAYSTQPLSTTCKYSLTDIACCLHEVSHHIVVDQAQFEQIAMLMTAAVENVDANNLSNIHYISDLQNSLVFHSNYEGITLLLSNLCEKH